MNDLLTTIWINAKDYNEFVKETKKQGISIIDDDYLENLFIETHKTIKELKNDINELHRKLLKH